MNKMVTVSEIELAINMYNISKIYLDADGVILQSIQASVQLLDEMYGIKLKPEDVVNWNFHESLTSGQIEQMFSDPKFFDIVHIYDGVGSFIERYIDKITVVTKGDSDNIRLKGEYFEQLGLQEMKYIGLPLNKSKGCVDMSGALFIDDCVANLNESNAMIKILFREFNNNADWQRGWSGLEMRSWL